MELRTLEDVVRWCASTEECARWFVWSHCSRELRSTSQITPSIVTRSSLRAACPMSSWNRVSSSAYDSPTATRSACRSRIARSSTSSSGRIRRAADAAIAGSMSPRTSITSVRVCPREMRFESGRARSSGPVRRTNVPPPARVSTTPRSSSERSASRTEARETWNCSARARSGGSWSPGRSSPLSKSD